MAVRVTSASTRMVAVSDQFRTDRLINRDGRDKSPDRIEINGHGPAIHVTRTLRNWFSPSASSEKAPRAAFHFPSAEQVRCPWQGTLPVFTTSNCFARLPTSTVTWLFIV